MDRGQTLIQGEDLIEKLPVVLGKLDLPSDVPPHGSVCHGPQSSQRLLTSEGSFRAGSPFRLQRVIFRIALPERVFFGHPGAAGLPARGNHPHNQRRKHQGHCQRGALVPPEELFDLVGSAGRAGQHRLIGQVALHVRAKPLAVS